uniref:(northern house mosquito) hypothetical protein n=1 Tax=Culex pipiens TaxID=7175 RepID=A0A8D8BIU0_CULPI
MLPCPSSIPAARWLPLDLAKHEPLNSSPKSINNVHSIKPPPPSSSCCTSMGTFTGSLLRKPPTVRHTHLSRRTPRYKKGNNFYGVYVTMTLTPPFEPRFFRVVYSARNPRAKFSHVVGGGGLRMPWEMSIKSPPSQRLCSRGRGLKQSAHFFFSNSR